MILIEIADWIWSNRGEVTLNAILLLILRKFIIKEMHKLLHLGREGEMKWVLQKVEKLTGEKYDGQPAFLKTVRTRYIGNSYFYLRKVIPHVYQQRRMIKVNQNINWISLIPAVAGAIKLILQPFGIDLSHVTDNQVNDIANGAAALATVIGIFMSHRKKPPVIVVSNIPPSGDNPQAVNHSY
jgi:uncharacterized membrane protein